MGGNIKSYLLFVLLIGGLVFESELYSQVDMDSLIYQKELEAYSNINNGKLFLAIDLYHEIIDLKQKHQTDDIESLADIYINLSVSYSKIGQRRIALENLTIAEGYYKKCNPEPFKIPNLYLGKSVIYRELGDYDRSERYLSLSIGKSKELETFAPRWEANYYNFRAGISLQKKEYKKFIEYIDIYNSLMIKYNIDHLNYRSIRIQIYQYLDIDSVRLAKKQLDFVNSELSKVKLDPETQSSWNFVNASYQKKVKNYDSALYYYRVAEKIILKNFKRSDPYYVSIMDNYQELYLEMENYPKVIEYSEKSLEEFDFYNDFDISASKNVSGSIKSYRDALASLKMNINVRLLLYHKEKDPNYLTKAYSNSYLLGAILDQLRWYYLTQEAEYVVDDKNSNYYKLGQKVCEELYRFTSEHKYLVDAFNFNERAKSYSLLSNLRNQSAMNYGGIPETLIEQESNLNLKISGYRELIYTEEQARNPDRNKLELWQNDLYEANQEYEKLVKFFDDNYPEYYKLKYDTEVINIDKVSNRLAKNEVIIEYSILDSTLFTYLISNEKKEVYTQRINEDFREKCLEFYDVLTQQSFSSGARKTFAQYTKLGHELYSILLDPIKDQLVNKNLIIIPDGEIAYISFESLLSKEVNPDKMNYYNLPYLILDHGFSTSFSSTVHFNEFPKKKKTSGEILAFAPTYDNISSAVMEDDQVRQGDRDMLIRIPGVKEEVKKISQILDSRVFMDLNATESAFKQNASDYKFLHLAMHTLLNDATPLYSKLAFTQSVDSIDDGFLYTYEIYNLQLNADLAVLSSCSSGYGTLQEGEGLQSLARGFAYAGCPSILMTLWEVSDNSTVEVMERFYHYLGKGYSKPEALHRSKLDFLQNADQLKSNPFFWSSFVLIGDTEPIYKSRYYQAGLNILLLMIPLPVFIVLYRRYRKEMRKKEMTASN